VEHRRSEPDRLLNELLRVLTLFLPHLACTRPSRTVRPWRGWRRPVSAEPPPIGSYYEKVVHYGLQTDWGKREADEIYPAPGVQPGRRCSGARRFRGRGRADQVGLLEGNTRGFLVLRPPGGEPIAYGELQQRPSGALIESRLLLNFKDGSLYDESVTFSQADIFRLEAYRLVQRGPSFPTADISFDRKSGHHKARTQEKKGDSESTASGPLDMPADLYNGLALVLLKNLPAGGGTGQMVVFTPKPRLIKMELTAEGEDQGGGGG